MTELDFAALRPGLDPEGAYERNIDLPRQLRVAWQAVQGFSLPAAYREIDSVIVAGMGGSAIAGDFLQAICYRESNTPVTVVRGYELPHWAGPRTLFIACSHSGNTEESLTDYEQALQRGCKIVVVTTGGRLKQLATEASLPLLAYDYYPEPRSAFGHGFMRLLAIANAAGVLNLDVARVDAAISETEMQRPSLEEAVPEHHNPAKAMAARLQGRLPYIAGAEFLAPAARRWKTQLNENADVWAIWDELPELHHNTVVGLGRPRDVADKVHAIILDHADYNERIRLRIEITTELLDRANVSYEIFNAGGPEPLAAMLRSVYFGSMLSYYLALVNNVHPTEIDNINYLKDRLA